MVKQTVFYIISVVLMRGISLLMLPIVARFLSPAELGVIEALSGIAILGSVLVGAGLEHALFRFSSGSSKEERVQVASSIYMMSLLLAVVFLVFTLSSHHEIARFLPFEVSSYLVCLTMLVLCFESAISVPLGYLRMTDRSELFCLSVLLRTCLHAGLTLLFLMQGRGVEGVLEASLMSVLIQALLLGKWHLGLVGVGFAKKYIKPVFFYAWPIVASGFLAFMLNGLDRWFVATFSPIEDLAYYGIAIKFSLALSLLMQPFGMWWMPRRFKVVEQDRRMYKIYVGVGLLALTSIYLVLALIVPHVIGYILPTVYMESIPLFLWLLTAIYFKEVTELINIGCFVGETKTQLVLNVMVTLVAVGLFFTLAPAMGVTGVAVGLTVAYLIKLMSFFYFSRKKIAVDYDVFFISKLFVFAAICVACHHAVLNGASTDAVIGVGVLSLLIFILMVARYVGRGDLSRILGGAKVYA